MASHTCLFIIQGEGRGHLTQALALDSMLRRRGHRVCSAVVSQGEDHVVPEYFHELFSAPIASIESAHFVMDEASHSIDWLKTLAANNRRWNHFAEAFTTIQEHILRERPDVIINFYEPLGGLFVFSHKPAVPMIAVGHQFMLLHPDYPFPEGFGIQRRSAKFFTNLVGLGAARRLALSLYDAAPLPTKRVVVVPPILRDEFFEVQPAESDPYFLVYLYHYTLAEAVVEWHKRNPSVTIHCFWNKPDAAEEEVVDDTLVFHRLHGQKFLDMMANCQGMVTTSGFETMSEAMYLGKPLLVNPVRNHFEQHCNAEDGRRLGSSVQTDSFNLDKLVRFVQEYRYDPTEFRGWVDQAEEIFVQQIDEVVAAGRRG